MIVYICILVCVSIIVHSYQHTITDQQLS